jgi:hypothetical protein
MASLQVAIARIGMALLTDIALLTSSEAAVVSLRGRSLGLQTHDVFEPSNSFCMNIKHVISEKRREGKGGREEEGEMRRERRGGRDEEGEMRRERRGPYHLAFFES